MKSKKKRIMILAITVIVALFLVALFFLVILPERSYKEIRQMAIHNVDLSSLEDGGYQGEYTYGNYTYEATVQIKDHRIEEILVSHGNESEYAKAAEGVLDRVITEQKIDVDVVSGATTTSKALLKAVENALSK